MRRLILLVVSGTLLTALAATAAFAQEQNTDQESPEGVYEGPVSLMGELTIECPPDDVGTYQLLARDPEGGDEVPLTDEDGDGVYTGEINIPEWTAGDLTEPRELNLVRIEAPDGTVVREWSPVVLDSSKKVFSATVNLCEEVNGGGLTGTAMSEIIYGTYGNNLVSGEGGDDFLVGEAGGDSVLGGPGNDFLVAAYAYFQTAPNAPASPDFIQGGEGNDLIDSADLAGAPDDVRCGPGNDLVYAGVEDFVANDCEVVYRYEGF